MEALAWQCRGVIVGAMPQRPKHLAITSVTVRHDEGAVMVRTGQRTCAPERFIADIQLAKPGVRLQLGVRIHPDSGGLPAVEAITVWASPETPLTSATLRQVLIDPLIRAAVAEANRPCIEIGPNAFHADGDPEYSFWTGLPAGATERVLQIARLYREAVTVGSRSPGLDAANAVHVSRAQAARYIRKARELGLIPPRDNAKLTREEPLQPIATAIVTSPLGVLIGRRNDGRPLWTFIAGEVEPGERPEFAAEREVKEESGLEVRAVRVLGERIHPKTGRDMIYIACAPVLGTDVFVGDPIELAEVKWADFGEATELLPGMFEPVQQYLSQELAGEDG